MAAIVSMVALFFAAAVSAWPADSTPVVPPPATPALPPYLATAPPAYTGAYEFPASLFPNGFWSGFEPTQTTCQPQPVITDPVTGSVFPLELTDPGTIPEINLVDPIVFPPSLLSPLASAPLPALTNLSTPGTLALASEALSSVIEIINNPYLNNSCAKCQAGLAVGKMLANTAPWEVPGVIIALCEMYNFSTTCAQTYGANADGDVTTQVLALGDMAGQDGQYVCAHIIDSACPLPGPNELDLSYWIPTPKPANAVAPPPSGERVRVLHISDFHLDPRYTNGAEADCSEYLCCRPYSANSTSPNATVLPAPRYGAYACDTPLDLAGIAVNAIPELAGAGPTGREFDWAIFTGDLVSHDSDFQLGRAYVEYEQVIIYGMLKEIIAGAPLYPTLGNHDTWPQAFNSPLDLQPAYLGSQFSWDYEHVSSLWSYHGWLEEEAIQYASVNYAAYAVTTWRGLKIISFNTDFWYWNNLFNYINTTDPDISGQLKFIADELQASEDLGQRVWIIGHHPPGWDTSNSMQNPTNLFYQIIDRYSPHVVAETFFGHTHEDELSIFYANNGTNQTAGNAVATSWIAPSLTPLTNLNSGFRAYDVDPVTFNILDSYTWISNISAAPALDQQTEVGAHYFFEYSAREAYGGNVSWAESDPLNATWWHLVTEQWEIDPTLVELFTVYESKNSVLAPNCTSAACVESKICYVRSASVVLASQCPYGSTYGSTQ